jgi:uncharacterized damage-inducible protein DinB
VPHPSTTAARDHRIAAGRDGPPYARRETRERSTIVETRDPIEREGRGRSTAMNLRDYAGAMAAYNEWMNGKLYAVTATLTDEERKRDLGAFFRSLHGTLNHLLLGDRAWMERFRGRAVTMKSPDEELYADFEELRAARVAMDAEIVAWAASLGDDHDTAPFRFFSVTYNRERVLPGWAPVVQMFNHQTHHRGQVTTLLKQLGRDPGVTDFPWMPLFDEV